jgi:hypothetical protein
VPICRVYARNDYINTLFTHRVPGTQTGIWIFSRVKWGICIKHQKSCHHGPPHDQRSTWAKTQTQWAQWVAEGAKKNIPRSLSWYTGKGGRLATRGGRPTSHLHGCPSSNAWEPTLGAYKYPYTPDCNTHTPLQRFHLQSCNSVV